MVRKFFRRSKATSRIKLTPRRNSEPECSKYIVSATQGSVASSSLAPLVGGAKNVTRPSGEAAAMARMNGGCQMTSPMPGFTWMTAVEGTLIAVLRLRYALLVHGFVK